MAEVTGSGLKDLFVMIAGAGEDRSLLETLIHDLRSFNKAVVQPALSLGVRENLWSQPYGRQTMAGGKNIAVI